MIEHVAKPNIYGQVLFCRAVREGVHLMEPMVRDEQAITLFHGDSMVAIHVAQHRKLGVIDTVDIQRGVPSLGVVDGDELFVFIVLDEKKLF